MKSYSERHPVKNDRQANQGSGHLQPGFGPELDIADIWEASRARSASNPKQKGGGLRPPSFWRVLEADGARSDPKYGRFAALAETLAAVAQNLV